MRPSFEAKTEIHHRGSERPWIVNDLVSLLDARPQVALYCALLASRHSLLLYFGFFASDS